MNRILKYVSAVRTHWKKSALGCVLVGCGANYGHEQLQIQSMMREFCEEAALLGDLPADSQTDAGQIAVILNPAANRRSAKKNFDKYCAPLLHLSGTYVTVFETTHEGHARKITDQLDPKTTAILVAGGDGTLSETVTGLMRGHGERVNVPVGVLPLGSCNTLATRLFGQPASGVHSMVSATMAVLRGSTRRLDMYRVETLDGEGEKAVYGVGWIEWGTWPWLKRRVKQLWYLGSLKKYVALLWPDESALRATVCGSLAYTAPCSGCSRCFHQRPDLTRASDSSSLTPHSASRWWSAFVKKPQATHSAVDFTSIDNEACSFVERRNVVTTGLRVTTGGSSAPSIVVSIGPASRYQGQLLFEGLRYLSGGAAESAELLEAKQLEIRPDISSTDQFQEENSSKVLLIDNEEFDLRPVRITILPNSLTVFCQ